MNPPKSDEYDYINFLIAAPEVFICTEAERVRPDAENPPSHDAVIRFLSRLSNDSPFLRNESSGFADLKHGISVSDDSARTNCTQKKRSRFVVIGQESTIAVSEESIRLQRFGLTAMLI